MLLPSAVMSYRRVRLVHPSFHCGPAMACASGLDVGHVG